MLINNTKHVDAHERRVTAQPVSVVGANYYDNKTRHTKTKHTKHTQLTRSGDEKPVHPRQARPRRVGALLARPVQRLERVGRRRRATVCREQAPREKIHEGAVLEHVGGHHLLDEGQEPRSVLRHLLMFSVEMGSGFDAVESVRSQSAQRGGRAVCVKKREHRMPRPFRRNDSTPQIDPTRRLTKSMQTKAVASSKKRLRETGLGCALYTQ